MLINLRNALMTGKRLPYDNEVEYLQSSGTQYIDTGVTPDFGLSMSATLCKTDTTSGFLLGARQANATKSFCLASFSTYARFDFGGTGGSLGQTNISPICDSNMHTISVAYPTITVDGTAKEMALASSFSLNQNIVLFANNTNGSITKYSGVRIAALKLYSNGVLVRDFIPVRKGTVGYLYDRVTRKLFGNAGTGDFVLGPDVVPVEYIESHGTEWIDTGYAFQDDFSWEIMFNGLGYNQTLFGGRTAVIRTALLYQRDQYVGVETTIPIAGYNGTTTPFVLPDLNSGAHTVKAAFAENKGSVWVDGVVRYTSQSFSGNYISGVSHAVFADNFGNGDVREFANSKVYALKMWQNDAIVRSFLPVRVGTEGAMMDVLTRRIYRNAGTGAFGYGNDLKYPIPAE